MEKVESALQKKIIGSKSALEAIEERLAEKKAELDRLNAVAKARIKANEIAIKEEEV